MAPYTEQEETFASANDVRIKVIGVGGGGGNAVQAMIRSGLRGVQFVCANTDLQALAANKASVKVQLGERLTKGLGAGANPGRGLEAAMESVEAIKSAIGEAHLVFVTAGMGGGTGTGAAPIVAKLAREQGALTIGVVTKPFDFEGPKRRDQAEGGIAELAKYVDSLIVIPNQRLFSFSSKNLPFTQMLELADDVLYHAVKGITDVIMSEGMINLDFADVKATMRESGFALMSIGKASGEKRAKEATKQAISSPLLEDVTLDTAKAILYNVTASRDIAAEEIQQIGEIIHDEVNGKNGGDEVNIIFGVIFDDDAGDELRITVVATGIEPGAKVRKPKKDDRKLGEMIGFGRREPAKVVPPKTPWSVPEEKTPAAARGKSITAAELARAPRKNYPEPIAEPLGGQRQGTTDDVCDDQSLDIPPCERAKGRLYGGNFRGRIDFDPSDVDLETPTVLRLKQQQERSRNILPEDDGEAAERRRAQGMV
ncbi:MAG: cell division protein FtsZ [Desulfovibrio sp.]|jgi:cell division protein FtsZ|nr:cell division protein FtsZ [Desulfovibrio sp.]